MIKSAENVLYSIEGRSASATIFKSGGENVGTMSTGGNIISVDIDEATATWSPVVSADQRVYLFSKSNTSTWYNAWSTVPATVPTVTVINEDGSYFAYGTASGYIYFYETVASIDLEADVWITVHVYKDGLVPYPYANTTLLYGDVVGTTFIEQSTGRTDSDGNYVFSAITGHYYQVQVNGPLPDREVLGNITIQASRTQFDYQLKLSSAVIAINMTNNVWFSNNTNTINMSYLDDSGTTTAINYAIKNSLGIEVYNETYYGSSVEATYLVTNVSDTYTVTSKVVKSGGTFQQVWNVEKKGLHYTDLSWIPFEIRYGFFFVFSTAIAGAISRRHLVSGCWSFVMIQAAYAYYGWIPYPWWMIGFGFFVCFLISVAEGRWAQ